MKALICSTTHHDFPGYVVEVWDPAVEYIDPRGTTGPVPGEDQEIVEVNDQIGLKLKGCLAINQQLMQSSQPLDTWYQLEHGKINAHKIVPKQKYPFREHGGKTWYTTNRARPPLPPEAGSPEWVAWMRKEHPHWLEMYQARKRVAVADAERRVVAEAGGEVAREMEDVVK